MGDQKGVLSPLQQEEPNSKSKDFPVFPAAAPRPPLLPAPGNRSASESLPGLRQGKHHGLFIAAVLGLFTVKTEVFSMFAEGLHSHAYRPQIVVLC